VTAWSGQRGGARVIISRGELGVTAGRGFYDWSERDADAACDLFGIAHPIINAPMAGSATADLAAAVPTALPASATGGGRCAAAQVPAPAIVAHATCRHAVVDAGSGGAPRSMLAHAVARAPSVCVLQGGEPAAQRHWTAVGADGTIRAAPAWAMRRTDTAVRHPRLTRLTPRCS
jgi:NAD(P)H-dependent flavin oxidoreductase YrpB (nitropropane dioxygenase family)